MADEQAQPHHDEQAKPPAKRKRRARLMSPLVPWLRVHWPSVLLTLLGLTMLGLGIFVEDIDAVAVTLVLLGPLIVVVGVLLELFAPRLLRLALSQSGLSAELAPPSSDELEQAGLPEGVADALEQWFDDVTRLLPIEIERQINEVLDERARRQSIRRAAYRRMMQKYEPREGGPPESGVE